VELGRGLADPRCGGITSRDGVAFVTVPLGKTENYITTSGPERQCRWNTGQEKPPVQRDRSGSAGVIKGRPGRRTVAAFARAPPQSYGRARIATGRWCSGRRGTGPQASCPVGDTVAGTHPGQASAAPGPAQGQAELEWYKRGNTWGGCGAAIHGRAYGKAEEEPI